MALQRTGNPVIPPWALIVVSLGTISASIFRKSWRPPWNTVKAHVPLVKVNYAARSAASPTLATDFEAPLESTIQPDTARSIESLEAFPSKIGGCPLFTKGDRLERRPETWIVDLPNLDTTACRVHTIQGFLRENATIFLVLVGLAIAQLVL